MNNKFKIGQAVKIEYEPGVFRVAKITEILFEDNHVAYQLGRLFKKEKELTPCTPEEEKQYFSN